MIPLIIAFTESIILFIVQAECRWTSIKCEKCSCFFFFLITVVTELYCHEVSHLVMKGENKGIQTAEYKQNRNVHVGTTGPEWRKVMLNNTIVGIRGKKANFPIPRCNRSFNHLSLVQDSVYKLNIFKLLLILTSIETSAIPF